MAIDLILGTAGHIDHGKTALIKALTGVDTDRLPEEKRRGITIDLGFAEWTSGGYRLGIVDVPGHERFVRNMLAGATGIDLALLVVAADDSVKPQTREHLQILRLLGLEAGVIALSKCDLAQPQWLDLVQQEVRALVAGTFLADAPMVCTSATRGLGMDTLCAALLDAARSIESSPRRRTTGPFRMAVDRSFAIQGHGTVVTGSIASGEVRVGDALTIEPGGLSVRVRGMEHHGRVAERMHRGQRAAINLAGVHHREIGRGRELASPGLLVPSRRMTVALELLASTPRSLRHRARVRLNMATAEDMATVELLDRTELRPGETALAQLVLDGESVALWGQPFVVRSESPVWTIGGGHVLEPCAAKFRAVATDGLRYVQRLSAAEPATRASAAVALRAAAPWSPADLVRLAGVEQPDAVYAQLVRDGDVLELPVAGVRTLALHRDVLRRLAGDVETTLARLHDANPQMEVFERSRLAGALSDRPPEDTLKAVLRWMVSQGRVTADDRGVRLADRRSAIDSKTQSLVEGLIGIYREAGLQPPTVEQVKHALGKDAVRANDLLRLALRRGTLVRINAEYCLHAEADARLRRVVVEALRATDGLTVGAIRELLATTRKYALPFCEYLDRAGVTRRMGDRRFAADSKSTGG